jgi:hypothetical protein
VRHAYSGIFIAAGAWGTVAAEPEWTVYRAFEKNGIAADESTQAGNHPSAR